jgi:hypothetical protein
MSNSITISVMMMMMMMKLIKDPRKLDMIYNIQSSRFHVLSKTSCRNRSEWKTDIEHAWRFLTCGWATQNMMTSQLKIVQVLTLF